MNHCLKYFPPSSHKKITVSAYAELLSLYAKIIKTRIYDRNRKNNQIYSENYHRACKILIKAKKTKYLMFVYL
jgi:hypothetical protein